MEDMYEGTFVENGVIEYAVTPIIALRALWAWLTHSKYVLMFTIEE